jgi:hypothetical protein
VWLDLNFWTRRLERDSGLYTDPKANPFSMGYEEDRGYRSPLNAWQSQPWLM